jgi:hypothetical protein
MNIKFDTKINTYHDEYSLQWTQIKQIQNAKTKYQQKMERVIVEAKTKSFFWSISDRTTTVISTKPFIRKSSSKSLYECCYHEI